MTLFPFLSVLACVIGVLTLLISAMAIGQVNPESLEQAEKKLIEQQKKYEIYLSILEKNKRLDRARQELKSGIPDLDRIKKELEAAKAKLQQLQQQLKQKQSQADSLNKKAAQFRTTLESLKKQIEALKKQIAAIIPEIRKLEDELKRRSKKPEAAAVVIKPGGSGTNLDPTFIECAGNSIVVHEGPKPKRYLRDNLKKDVEFLDLVDRVAAKKNGTIVFLVRGNGIWTYYYASDIANKRGCHNGKLPVIGDGKIDLSMFGKKK